MAAGPSPSPSGSRRLSELLDQQQEPFSLDLCLLERGCSPAFLDAAVGAGACSTCWPWPGTRSAAGKKKVRSAARMKVSCGSSVLRLLLCKLLRGNITPAPTARKQQQLRSPTIGVDDGENRSSAPFAAEARTEKAEEELQGDDSKKRFSPEFVSEQGLEHSPQENQQKTLLIFRNFLQAAYSRGPLDLVAIAKQSSRSNSFNNSGTKSSPVAAAARNNRADWKDDEEEKVFEEALTEATAVLASELAGGGSTTAWPGDVQPERRDVGADTAAAVLDALVEETATELMTGMDGHDVAVDMARQHCCVSGG